MSQSVTNLALRKTEVFVGSTIKTVGDEANLRQGRGAPEM